MRNRRKILIRLEQISASFVKQSRNLQPPKEMKAVDSSTPSETGDGRAERSRLLREFFLNAAMLAVMKETVDEAVELERLEREVARDEERAISVPAA